MQTPSVRHFALECLLQKAGTIPFPVLLEQCYQKFPQNYSHASQDKAFLMSLCYGVLRHAGILKKVLAPYCKKKPDPLMEHCLLLALYEIFFLEKEVHASIFEYVELVKKAEKHSAGQKKAGAVNAILRALVRDREKIQTRIGALQEEVQKTIFANQIPAKKILRRLHELADLPQIFTDELDKAFVQSLVQNSFFSPIPSYRLNLRKESPLPENAVFLPDSRSIFYSRQSADYTALFEQGNISRQGIASALFAENIADFCRKNNLFSAPAQNMGIWDMCCGRGGKSLALINLGMHVSLASEPNPARIAEFKKELARLGYEEPAEIFEGLAEHCAEQYLQYARQQKFPLIVLDSPCTTSGTIARNPEVKYRISPESLAEILHIQENLLDLAYGHLEDTGCIFYCTCSVFACENKGQIRKFLQKHADMQCLHEDYLYPAAMLPKLKGHDILYYAILQKA